MKKITFKGKTEKITAPEERCLRQMARNDFADVKKPWTAL